LQFFWQGSFLIWINTRNTDKLPRFKDTCGWRKKSKRIWGKCQDWRSPTWWQCFNWRYCSLARLIACPLAHIGLITTASIASISIKILDSWIRKKMWKMSRNWNPENESKMITKAKGDHIQIISPKKFFTKYSLRDQKRVHENRIRVGAEDDDVTKRLWGRNL